MFKGFEFERFKSGIFAIIRISGIKKAHLSMSFKKLVADQGVEPCELLLAP